MAGAIGGAVVFALANYGLTYADKKEGEQERKRHDLAVEKYTKEKFEYQKQRAHYHDKLISTRKKLEKSNYDVDGALANLDLYFNITKPVFDFTPSSKQKLAEEIVEIAMGGGVVVGSGFLLNKFIQNYTT